jgi:hypothetical protein
LVFLDESGCNAAMAREYARAPIGERAEDDLGDPLKEPSPTENPVSVEELADGDVR